MYFNTRLTNNKIREYTEHFSPDEVRTSAIKFKIIIKFDHQIKNVFKSKLP